LITDRWTGVTLNAPPLFFEWRGHKKGRHYSHIFRPSHHLRLLHPVHQLGLAVSSVRPTDHNVRHTAQEVNLKHLPLATLLARHTLTDGYMLQFHEMYIYRFSCSPCVVKNIWENVILIDSGRRQLYSSVINFFVKLFEVAYVNKQMCIIIYMYNLLMPSACDVEVLLPIELKSDGLNWIIMHIHVPTLYIIGTLMLP